MTKYKIGYHTRTDASYFYVEAKHYEYRPNDDVYTFLDDSGVIAIVARQHTLFIKEEHEPKA